MIPRPEERRQSHLPSPANVGVKPLESESYVAAPVATARPPGPPPMTQMSGVSTFAIYAFTPEPDAFAAKRRRVRALRPRIFLTLVASIATSTSANKATVISG